MTPVLEFRKPARAELEPCALSINSKQLYLSLSTIQAGVVFGYEHKLSSQIPWVSIPSLPFTSCVTLGKLLNLSAPQLPI